MMQITATLSSLTQPEREHLAAFILAYPVISSLAGDPDEEPEEERAAFASNLTTQDEPEEPAAVSDAEAAAMFGASPEQVFSAPALAAGPILVPNPPSPTVAAAGSAAAIASVPSQDDRLDKAGLPWDERIHASSRAKTADGSWRKKRGIDEGTVIQVETELRALMALPGVVHTQPVPAAPTLVPAPPVPAAVVEDRQAYVSLLSMASAAILAKTLTTEQLAAAVVAVGVPSLPLLANRLDLVPQVLRAIKALIDAAK